MKDNLQIGNRIRDIREGLNMNRDRFSEMIGISEAFLGQIERGERSISLNTLLNISKSTGFSTDFILLGDTTNNTIIDKINRLAHKDSEDFLNYVYDLLYNASTFYDNIKK